MARKPITEESGEHKAWKEQAEKIRTPEELSKFVRHLTEDYEHDYGTICHAITAAMLASYKVINNSPQGGITGFQASCIGWEMVEEFMGRSEGGKRLMRYEDLLYPQYESKFRTISSYTAEWLKKAAADKLAEHHANPAHPNVMEHWKRLADGEIPFGLTVVDD